MNETTTVYKWFWTWQDDKEEAWLQSMSARGFHLQKSPFLGFYKFTTGEPTPYTYRMDFKEDKKDQKQYIQLFADAGWDYLGLARGGWRYFRKVSAPGDSPEIFTDTASKIMKYKRVVGYLYVTLPVYLIVFLPAMDSYPTWFMIFLALIFFSSLTYSIIAINKVEKRIKALQSF